ncbi:MAG: nucleoside deaminase [Bdellovibrionales bacterium]
METQSFPLGIAMALELAQSAAERGEVPVGAVVVKDGVVLATAQNRVERDRDPTAHAEMLAIREATQKLGNKFLNGCDLYVSLEPCAMCAGAIAMARVQRVVFAATDPKGGAVLHGPKFFDQPTCHHRPVIEQVTEHAEAAGNVLKEFFKAKR